MKRSTIYLILFLGVLSACETDTKDNQKEILLGHWELVEADRNGQPTESLDQLYYEFEADGKMRTNLTGATETGTYELDDNQLMQKGTKVEATYTIETLTDSTLVLQTELRNNRFKLSLVRKILEE